MSIEGLPEGVAPVAYRAAEAGDYVMVSPDCVVLLDREQCAGVGYPHLVVAPAEGYIFELEQFSGSYKAIRPFEKPIRYRATFEVRTEAEAARLSEAVHRFKGLKFFGREASKESEAGDR